MAAFWDLHWETNTNGWGQSPAGPPEGRAGLPGKEPRWPMVPTFHPQDLVSLRSTTQWSHPGAAYRRGDSGWLMGWGSLTGRYTPAKDVDISELDVLAFIDQLPKLPCFEFTYLIFYLFCHLNNSNVTTPWPLYHHHNAGLQYSSCEGFLTPPRLQAPPPPLPSNTQPGRSL